MKSITLLMIAASILGAATLVCARQNVPEQSNKNERQPRSSFGAQMLTPTEGVDFAGYLAQVLSAVRTNWYAKMPAEAKQGKRGKVVVRFKIQRDGALLDQGPTLELSSEAKALDNAALDAVRTSTPFEHLPDAFKGPNIELRFSFSYNLPEQHQ
jgi:TonB family protein